MKVRAYKTQTGIRQCYNCQCFSHIQVLCKQPPTKLSQVWGGYCHQEFPRVSAAFQQLQRVYLCQEGAREEKAAYCWSLGTPWLPYHFHNYFSKEILHCSQSKLLAATIARRMLQNKHLKNVPQVMWVHNHHNPAGHDESADSRH